MLKTCVKHVDRAGTFLWKAGVRLSTYSPHNIQAMNQGSAKQRLITSFIPTFPLQLSPAKIAILPLTEHYLYPVSTGPITNPTKEN